MDTKLLEEIGLTKSEVNVYLALLELGSSSTGKIVDKSKASSSKIYEILDKLIQKGLVSFIVKAGIKYFEAAPPGRITDYMKEKEENLNKQKNELKKLIPKLEMQQKLAELKSEATIFKGMKGGETAFRTMINSMEKDDEWLAFVIDFKDEKYYDLLTKLHTWRAEKGLKSRLIINQKHKKVGKHREKLKNTKVKYVSEQSQAVVNVAGNIVLLNVMAKEVMVIMIESKEVADSFRNQFEKLWEQDVKIHKGFEAVTKRFAAMRDGLNRGEAYYTLGATFGLGGEKLRKWFVKYHQERIKKGVIANLLTVARDYEEVKRNLRQPPDTEMKLAKIKRLPPDFYTQMQIVMYKGNKVLMLLFGKEMMCFEIESQQLYKNFKKYFDALWSQETRIVKGIDAIQGLFEEMLDYSHCDFIGAKGYFVDKRPKYIDDWEKRAIKKGFTMRNIVDPETKGHRITKFPFAKTKYTLPKEFTTLSVYWIYGDKVLISNWMGDEPILLVIENKQLHNMYKKQFELLWKKKIIG
jgi:sugar-specific transcriptional regulator TrmB